MCVGLACVFGPKLHLESTTRNGLPEKHRGFTDIGILSLFGLVVFVSTVFGLEGVQRTNCLLKANSADLADI